MTGFLLLWNREVRTTFHSFGVYALLAIVTAVTGYFFNAAFRGSGYDVVMATRQSFQWLLYLAIILAPLLTMRLFAEEKRSGSIELLMTAPVSDLQVVAAKYAGAVNVFVVFLLPIWAFHLILNLFFGEVPDWGQLIATTIGVMGVGLLFLAVGIFSSAVCSMQLWAGLLGLVGNILLFLVGDLARLIDPDAWTETIFRHVSLSAHLASASKGVIDLRHVVFQMGLSLAFLFITIRVVEARKWR